MCQLSPLHQFCQELVPLPETIFLLESKLEMISCQDYEDSSTMFTTLRYGCFDPIQVFLKRASITQMEAFLAARLKWSAKFLTVLCSSSTSQQNQLYLPRVLRVKGMIKSPNEDYKNELERVRGRARRVLRSLSGNLFNFYLCLPKGNKLWNELIEYDGFLSTLSLLGQFGERTETSGNEELCWQNFSSEDISELESVCSSQAASSRTSVLAVTLLKRAASCAESARHRLYSHAVHCLVAAGGGTQFACHLDVDQLLRLPSPPLTEQCPDNAGVQLKDGTRFEFEKCPRTEK
ncbi:uncharacterized protein LOC108682363 isoform X2 [Hyalella azteca]|uniref:Uncharacterized protein LOC108682363 isoform X2 n=1 Tax=Hyalella azteca TaxID=294128 RepID=A0A8B7PNJ4_HYAAZ|nr:uncharacterized protein LOC108682363 isoform X2 [Hyalella azteca]